MYNKITYFQLLNAFNNLIKLTIIYFISIAFLTTVNAQQKLIKVQIINTDKSSEFKTLKYQTTFPSSVEVQQEVSKIYLQLINAGHLTANIDSIQTLDSTKLIVYLHIGKQFQQIELINYEKLKSTFNALNIKLFKNTSQTFNYSRYYLMMESIINYYENNGYPFCQAYLDSIQYLENKIKAKLIINKNQLVKIDSIVIPNQNFIKTDYLLSYLNLNHGMLYHEKTLKNISKNLSLLPFLTQSHEPIVKFTDKHNKLYLSIIKKPATQFDGIIGFLPNTTNGITITGDVKFKTINTIIKNGETIDLNWRRLQFETQDVKAQFTLPYLFSTSFGIDYALKLFIKDSTFIDVQNFVTIDYFFKTVNKVKMFYQHKSSSLNAVQNNTSVLPENADIETKSYGLGLTLNYLNHKLTPTKGILYNITANAGTRDILKNPKINDIAYQNIQLSSNQFQLENQLIAYINLYNQHVLKLSNIFGTLNGNNLFNNELFRIGGFKTLRGFDEESIYASTYNIFNAEYRFVFSENSFLFSFCDLAWAENANTKFYKNNSYISLGAGIAVETKAGILNFCYAIGKQSDSNFNFRSGKIHVGLITLF